MGPVPQNEALLSPNLGSSACESPKLSRPYYRPQIVMLSLQGHPQKGPIIYDNSHLLATSFLRMSNLSCLLNPSKKFNFQPQIIKSIENQKVKVAPDEQCETYSDFAELGSKEVRGETRGKRGKVTTGDTIRIFQDTYTRD